MTDRRRYCLVSPCRDEEAFLPRTLASVAAQTELPMSWVIVDDGSSDSTPRILDLAAKAHPWISVVRREDRGRRKVGPGVVDAFYDGYASISEQAWDYVCKLDVDLELPPTYFANLMTEMARDPRLGSVSGQPWYTDERTGRLVREDTSFEMSVGMSKFYRRRCFEQIGGLVRAVMWDGIDCHRARMLGWRTRALDAEEVAFRHLRPMGTSHRGIWTGRRRHGYGQYFMGTSALYATASAARRLLRRPLVIGGLAMWWGYTSSALRRERRIADPAFRKFLRGCQRKMLVRGKRRAIDALEAERAGNWAPDAQNTWPLASESPLKT